jgi:hypothetical protein
MMRPRLGGRDRAVETSSGSDARRSPRREDVGREAGNDRQQPALTAVPT